MTSLPIIGVFLAFTALCVSYRNLRLSHSCIVCLKNCESGLRHSAKGDSGIYFEVTLLNIGLPLHNISMSLGFRAPKGLGSASYPLKSTDGKWQKDGQFAKGMRTKFVINSRFFEAHDKEFLLSIRDLREQEARLFLFSEGFEAWSMPLVPRWYGLRQRWNRMAYKINGWFEKKVGKNEFGGDVIRSPRYLPAFIDPPSRFFSFLRLVTDEGIIRCGPLHHEDAH